MSRCTECDARIDPGMECIWFEEPRCSDCCGCDDDEPTTPPTAALRTEAEAAAVPRWSIVRSARGDMYTTGLVFRPDGARVGDTVTHVAVPVEVLQRHEAAVADDVTVLRQQDMPNCAARLLARHRELWPEELAIEPEPIEEVARRVAAAEVPDPDDARRLAAAVIGVAS